MRGRRARLLGAAIAFGHATAGSAADLGAACCDDLDERLTEIEATVAHRGTRTVSLEVSGWVNTALLHFDDGGERNTYVVDNAQDRTRLRLRGQARISADLEAGYLIEIGLRQARSDRVSAGADDTGDGVDVRHSNWFVASKSLGKVTIGQTSQASDGITQLNVAKINHVARSQVFDWNGGFAIRRDGTATAGRWRDLAVRESPGEGNRQNLVRYDSPTWQGFTLAASWGEDDVADVALRYAGEIGGIKLAAGAALARWSDSDAGGTTCIDADGRDNPGTRTDCTTLGLSASALHTASGLFATVAYGTLVDDERRAAASAGFTAARADDRDSFAWLQAGIQQRWLAAGPTTLYGELYRGNFGTPTRLDGSGNVRGRQIGGADILTSDVEMWGFGLNQSIAAAGIDVYAGFRAYEVEAQLETGARIRDLDGFKAVLAGAIVRF